MIRATSRPAIWPASLVACRCAVVEVGRHRDDGLVHLVAQIRFGRFLQLAQNHRRDFGRRVLLVRHANLDVVLRPADDLVGDHLLFGGHFAVPPAHETLDRIDGLLGIGDDLPAGRLADEHVAFVGERDDARRQAIAL